LTMKVFKFGGASIKDANSIKNMSDIVAEYPNDRLVIVVSAMGKTTNHLEKIVFKKLKGENFNSELTELSQYHFEIIQELFDGDKAYDAKPVEKLFDELGADLNSNARNKNGGQLYDAIVSYGELLSSTIIGQYLKEKGYDETAMLTAGLIIEAENGKTHDRFRGKLMIPIHDSKGRTTGFGSRVLDDSLPKYVNSPQTPTFDKSSTLYAIDLAAAAIRKQDAAIIMEGYMDVITAHQNGITNTVACMGTAVTETQVNALKKLSKNLLLALDADAAGEEAMLRTVGYENITGSEIRVIVLPEGKDPDDLIRENTDTWQGLMETAVPLVDYTFDKAISKLDLSTAGDKSRAVDRLLPIVAEIKDPIRQAHYIQKLAGMVKVGIPTIEAALARIKPAPIRRKQPAQRQVPAQRKPTLTADLREEYCLSLLCSFPELREREQEVSISYFECSENREIFAAWQKSNDLNAIKECLDAAICEHLDVILSKELPGKNNIERRFSDCVNRLREKYLKNLAARRAESGDTGDEDLEISAQLKSVFAQRNHRKL